MGKHWSAEDRIKALVLCESMSLAEVASKTGIPRGTLGRWRSKRQGETKRNEAKRESKKIRRLAAKAEKAAQAELAGHIVDVGKQVADKLLAVVQHAIQEIDNTIGRGPLPDEDRSKWVQAQVGVVAQGVKNFQLLSGKPTGINEQRVDGDSARERLASRVDELAERRGQKETAVGAK